MFSQYGTGMWPTVNPLPWNFNMPPGVGAIIDPVAVASVFSLRLREIGWPGSALMDMDFQMSLLDVDDATLSAAVEQWFVDHQQQVCDQLQQRVQAYAIDTLSPTAKRAMEEALAAYRQSRWLSVVRVLLPEFEAFGRAIAKGHVRQYEAVKHLKDRLNATPVIKDDPTESFSLVHFVFDHLFASCHSAEDAAALRPFPNRHAELHGLDSYGTLQGASTLLCVFAYLMRLMDRQKQLGAIV
nr:hypothetical protein [Nitrosomonas nitrosa]